MTAEIPAKAVIEALGLQPHPEGGYYAETFRDGEGGARAHSTAIYFLLVADQVSAWHRVKDAAEVWHHYAGAGLELSVACEGASVERHILGVDILHGERPQHVVPAGAWQSARCLGAWTLAGCTVAPGFTFDAFEMAPEGWAPQ